MIIYEKHVKIGCTILRSDSGDVNKTDAQKAKHFADQWQRSNFDETLLFYMVDIAAPMKDGGGCFTKVSWENEAFRQIDELLEETVDATNISSQPCNEILHAEIEELENNPLNTPLKGKFYRQPKNSTKTETRRLFKDDQQANNEQHSDQQIDQQTFNLTDQHIIKQTFIPEYLTILDGICDQFQSTFLAHRRRIRELRASLPQGIDDNEVCTFYEKNWQKCYQNGQSRHGTVNSDHNSGGGSLPLSPFSAYKLFFAFINSLPVSKDGRLTIYWIGCGWGEEICLIALLAKTFDFPMHITATEYEDTCIGTFQNRITLLELGQFITVKQEDLFRVNAIQEEYDIIYTSACPHPCFSLKLLYLSLKSAKTQYLLWNTDHNNHVISRDGHSAKAFSKLIEDKVTIVKAYLGRDDMSQEMEDRTIFAIKLGTHATRTGNMLAYLKDFMLRDEFYALFQTHFGTSEEPKTTSSIYRAVRQKIIENADSNDIIVDLSPWLHHKLDVESTITVTTAIREEYHLNYHANENDKKRKSLMKEFWCKYIYPAALEKYEQQDVLTLDNDAEVDVNSHFTDDEMLTFQPMVSKKLNVSSKKRSVREPRTRNN